ncbi:MAG: AEC family transporter [Candidatus Aenigmarchaeota archaeon]|nr:AEC family transporter [Candidatus Aenigmarchaeota archaeon]
MPYLIITAFALGLIIKQFYHHHSRLRIIINTYIMYIGLPLIILIALMGSNQIDFGKITLISILFNICSTITFFVISSRMNIRDKKKASLFLCTAFGNIAYLGIPYSLLFFGNIGASISAIFAIVTAFFHFTLGVVLSSSFHDKKKMHLKEMINPIMIGMIVALIISQTGISIPNMIYDIAHFGTYLLLFVIGLTTTLRLPTKDYIAGITGKIIISPIIMILLLFLTGNVNNGYYSFIFLAMMPPAFSNIVLSINYGFDKEYTSKLISMTTILMIIVFTAASFLI